MKTHIFQPLGLNKTTLYPTEAAPTMATGYKNGFFKHVNINPLSLEETVPLVIS